MTGGEQVHRARLAGKHPLFVWMDFLVTHPGDRGAPMAAEGKWKGYPFHQWLLSLAFLK